ncbi:MULTISPECIES: transcriptional regulator TyrR [Pseudoalteromonas]|uniref:HTH-type transcriptional regulatory protein TyrR n=1 Tax=Pseudoalteromonas ruthenica TaxID=151081 RepID=A0A0F4Q0Q2_9GAMM|nr:MULTISPECIES: transcriptional regulator TyrR [Pseudoalteromonas]KJZ00894.1 transcriptional regulator [Pseudoalteromonas ruthenica]KJZ01053.1 transcriptional regulator [Pseudoalteromonas ruthenica]MCF2863193.1 transcriptional regulator TyrR [Pseudoalteromonas sp. CNAT2-18]MCG7542943.1 transcriptional regulator TyrR [Pseudoalteromonas sp. MM17-2]MCG7559345.1 transcriptional regulator TyrR [Pseudoalteromonas sp. CNAT2-18.1]|tara:strand:+ start:8525 stop:10081 length:1557 start_codon:yes stop_codon:yes gene_type:complete
MRLEIYCQDRIGIAQEILNILVSYQVDLKGIEVDAKHCRMYVSFPPIEFEQFQKIMPSIRLIDGVEDVRTTAFMPSEREHNELNTLLSALPDGVISIDNKGWVRLCNAAACRDLQLSEQDVVGANINNLLKGFNFTRWLEGSEVLGQTTRVEVAGEDFIADILPISVPQGEEQDALAGAVINIKSQSRLGQQVSAFRRYGQESFATIHNYSTAMRRTVREARKMAQLDAPILITGETGTGKELMARACHYASNRSVKPFIALSCASLPDDVAESELFGYAGYEDNAAPKRGVLEQADGGTVFLDEVGEMSTQLQTKLLRFLQDGTFRKVGDENEVKVNVRIIAATQKDLPAMVQEGGFREDLYYRINVLTLEISPLRDRKADIGPLAEHFVQKYAQQNGATVPSLSKECIEYLEQYPWPGNVRQLENAIYRAVSLLDDSELTVEHLQLPSFTNDLGYLESDFEGSLDQAVKRFEATLLRKLYPAYPSSRQLAKRLGLSHTAVANKLREYGINRKTVKV